MELQYPVAPNSAKHPCIAYVVHETCVHRHWLHHKQKYGPSHQMSDPMNLYLLSFLFPPSISPHSLYSCCRPRSPIPKLLAVTSNSSLPFCTKHRSRTKYFTVTLLPTTGFSGKVLQSSSCSLYENPDQSA